MIFSAGETAIVDNERHAVVPTLHRVEQLLSAGCWGVSIAGPDRSKTGCCASSFGINPNRSCGSTAFAGECEWDCWTNLVALNEAWRRLANAATPGALHCAVHVAFARVNHLASLGPTHLTGPMYRGWWQTLRAGQCYITRRISEIQNHTGICAALLQFGL